MRLEPCHDAPRGFPRKAVVSCVAAGAHPIVKHPLWGNRRKVQFCCIDEPFPKQHTLGVQLIAKRLNPNIVFVKDVDCSRQSNGGIEE